MYAITATVETTVHSKSGDWHGARQIPTFYLDENVQGIVSEAHAERIAREIIDPLSSRTVHVCAVKL
jgi:hypothetical protein